MVPGVGISGLGKNFGAFENIFGGCEEISKFLFLQVWVGILFYHASRPMLASVGCSNLSCHREHGVLGFLNLYL